MQYFENNKKYQTNDKMYIRFDFDIAYEFFDFSIYNKNIIVVREKIVFKICVID